MGGMKHLSLTSPLVISAGIASVVACCIAAPALAADQQADHSNADLVSLLNAQVAPRHPSAHYSDAGTGRGFTLDRTGPQPLLKYDDSDEVYALSVSNAPRGDEFLKNDVGRIVLKVTELGNVILFMPGDKHGSPAGLDGQTEPLSLPTGSAGDAEQGRSSPAQAESAVAGVMITIEDELAQYDNWAQDALGNAMRGVRRAGVKISAPLAEIRLSFEKAPSARYADGVLDIGVAPHQGYAGRPSSEAVARAMSKPR